MISLSHVFNAGDTEWKSTSVIIADMVAEFGISKTHNTIQALFDADRLSQDEAGTLLDVLKMNHCSRKQAARMIPLI